MSNNPLIDYPDLPPFSRIQPEHVLPAVEQLVADGRARIQQVLAEGNFDYAHLVQALDEEDDRLGKAFGPAGISTPWPRTRRCAMPSIAACPCSVNTAPR